MTITDNDVTLIKKFEDILKHNYYASGSEVTTVYNGVFNTHLSSTNCSSCIRSRVQKLVQAMNIYLSQLELPKEREETQVIEKEENKPQVEEKKEETTNGTSTHTSGEQGVARKKRSKKANANG